MSDIKYGQLPDDYWDATNKDKVNDIVERLNDWMTVDQTTTPASRLAEAAEEELERGLKMFICLLDYWKIKNKYNP